MANDLPRNEDWPPVVPVSINLDLLIMPFFLPEMRLGSYDESGQHHRLSTYSHVTHIRTIQAAAMESQERQHESQIIGTLSMEVMEKYGNGLSQNIGRFKGLLDMVTGNETLAGEEKSGRRSSSLQ